MSGTSVFFSYASEDKLLVEKLKKYLILFKQKGLIVEWYDHNILPGTLLNEERARQLNNASLIVLCISPDFFVTDHCRTEMTRAMERYESGDAHVLPILLKHALWKDAPFASLEPLPSDGRFVTSGRPQAKVLKDIANGFEKVLLVLEAKEKVFSQYGRATISSSMSTFMVPFRRDPFFTGREEALTALRSLLVSTDEDASTLPPALCGFPGIGKTQVAIEYAYRYRQEYTNILWVNSAKDEEIIKSFTAIAGFLKLTNDQISREESITLLVKEWLMLNTAWLLIFDNVEDMGKVAICIPVHHRGHIIFTTMLQALGGMAKPIYLEKMTLDEGALLIIKTKIAS